MDRFEIIDSVATPITILPQDPRQAILELIKVTQKLVDIAEREAQALAQDDMLSFAILQDEKAYISERYVKLSEEFRGRLNDFRGTDKTMLDRLDKLQVTLGKKSRENNAIVGEMYTRSKTRTQHTLLAAQEIGRNVHITYPEKSAGEDA